MIPNVLGTKPIKEKADKAIIYYPARRFLGTDDNMDDIKIIVRKVNNTLTNIKLEDSERLENKENWRSYALIKAWNTLENVLGQIFK